MGLTTKTQFKAFWIFWNKTNQQLSRFPQLYRCKMNALCHDLKGNTLKENFKTELGVMFCEAKHWFKIIKEYAEWRAKNGNPLSNDDSGNLYVVSWHFQRDFGNVNLTTSNINYRLKKLEKAGYGKVIVDCYCTKFRFSEKEIHI